MIILGIDPGYAIVGYGVIEYIGNKFRVLEYGSIETKAGTGFPLRLKQINKGIEELIERYSPDAVDPPRHGSAHGNRP